MTQPPLEPDEPHSAQHASEPSLPEDAEVARQRRLDTLRELAQKDAVTASASTHGQSISAPTNTPARTPATSRRRPWLPLIGAALVIILIAAGASAYLLTRPHTTTTHALPAVVTITSANCAVSAVWSPDGKMLAALELPCANMVSGDISLQNATLSIYNAVKGNLEYQQQASNVLGASAANDNFDGLGWSPDSKNVALEGSVSDSPPNVIGSQPTVVNQATYTLAIIPAQGGAIQVLHATLKGAYSPSNLLALEPVWNLKAQKSVNKTPLPLPAALSYQWTADGSLGEAQPFPTSEASGNTGRGGANGTIPFWQDGILEPLFPKGKTGSGDIFVQPLAIEFLSAPTAIWSPDGVELTFATFSGLLAGAQPLTAQTCANATLPSSPSLEPLCPGPAITPPNAAVVNLVSAMLHPMRVPLSDGTTYTTYLGVSLAWSPHGGALATIEPSNQFVNNGADNGLTVSGKRATTVTLLATTGQTVGQRSYTCQASACFTPLLAWSPTGAQLALVDTANGVTTLWNTQQVKE